MAVDGVLSCIPVVSSLAHTSDLVEMGEYRNRMREDQNFKNIAEHADPKNFAVLARELAHTLALEKAEELGRLCDEERLTDDGAAHQLEALAEAVPAKLLLDQYISLSKHGIGKVEQFEESTGIHTIQLQRNNEQQQFALRRFRFNPMLTNREHGLRFILVLQDGQALDEEMIYQVTYPRISLAEARIKAAAASALRAGARAKNKVSEAIAYYSASETDSAVKHRAAEDAAVIIEEIMAGRTGIQTNYDRRARVAVLRRLVLNRSVPAAEEEQEEPEERGELLPPGELVGRWIDVHGRGRGEVLAFYEKERGSWAGSVMRYFRSQHSEHKVKFEGETEPALVVLNRKNRAGISIGGLKFELVPRPKVD